MTALAPHRQPAGIPAGGQFAALHRQEGSVLLIEARRAAASVGALVRGTASSLRERSAQRRASAVKPYSTRARVAVAGLLLVTAGVLTACGPANEQNCQAAPASVAVTATTASFSTGVAARGGHGIGHGAGHETSHSSSRGGGFRIPWFHSSNDEKCEAPQPASTSSS